MALNKEALDKWSITGCSMPGCKHTHDKCHPTSHLAVSYYQGIIRLECPVCEKKIAEIEVSK